MLAIWSDVTPEQETDYLHWLTREHTAERVGIPGFEAVRVFRADLPEVCRYLILYDLAAPSVLTSPAYLARLNAPTPWSQRIMPTLQNFARGGGWVRTVRGTGGGAHLLPLRLGGPSDAAEPLLGDLAEEDRICAVRLLEVDREGSGVPTNEKALRSGDASFPGLLLIEATGSAALQRALSRHQPAIAAISGDGEGATVYTAVFSLRKAELEMKAADSLM
ncbi:hypothetical protein [Teichococcus vastitatis]|uniref:Uncharacterized protein n=1 Tax=Teichococcus vastitatis TaxID=2307076 RepID=A0ABS9W8L6_9PROT|nr:hypothetical protein [Pseudoroseomonas vastitatis]MCI0755637.1 hypothetical protein [Pseudoroseomonas vastitatis]